MTASCPDCRAELPEGARFCPSCGTRLEASGPEATERKLVTTLFADLVGFTALGERHDPEDIDAALRGFYGLARTIVERFGGVVEKFIGDAVVGLFGVPAAHEDDAERAVRAALELVAHLHELPPVGGEQLRVRCAVNTGPALVRLRARPEAGEGVLVGDAVNTCSRLLAQAPPMGVVVGETTHRLCARAIAWEALPSATVRGKAKPVRQWLASAPLARRGVDSAGSLTPLIGREVEMGVLTGLIDKSIASQRPQIALITGEAGLGKTRLLRELFREMDERPRFCTWRQGRCPPYGSELAFWPLREIVTAHAGILPSDDESSMAGKLAQSLEENAQSEWLLERLRPLAGLPATQLERDDNFAAWRLFFERMAQHLPTILVIEDLHWASDSTLSFLEDFCLHVAHVPLTLLTTARPEFLDDVRSEVLRRLATQIDLRGLSREESLRLIRNLPFAPDDAEVAGSVGGLCGGNPLFAEELARYMSDRDSDSANAALVGHTGDRGVSAPDSIKALLAARLDALPEDRRRVIGDAAVVGQVFWPEAVAAAGSPVATVGPLLNDLSERDFFVSQDSLLAGSPQFAFRHSLVRQVAYERLTRSRRARKHAHVASWMKGLPGAGFGADVLAHHYETAFDLALDAGDQELVGGLRRPTAKALEAAGDLVRPLDVATAERCFRKAADLLGDDVDVAQVLTKWADTLVESGRYTEGFTVQDDLIATLQATGQDHQLAVARTRKAIWRWMIDSSEWPQFPEAGVDLLQSGEDSEELVALLEYWATICFYRGEQFEGEVAANRAIRMSERLDSPLPVFAQNVRGIARCEQGDLGGIEDLELALAEARRRGSELKAGSIAQNLADQLCAAKGPGASVGLLRETVKRARRRHDEHTTAEANAALALYLWWSGDWREADVYLEALLDDPGGRGSEFLAELESLAALSSLLRGSLDDAQRLSLSSELASRTGKRFWTRSRSLLVLAIVEAERGDSKSAVAHLRTCLDLEGGGRLLPEYMLLLPSAGRVCLESGARRLAERLASRLGTRPLDTCVRGSLHASLIEADGHDATHLHAAVAHQWHGLGVPYEEAWATLAAAHCLDRRGSLAEAWNEAQRAREIFYRLGAILPLSRVDGLLQDLGLRLSRAQRD